MIKVYILRIFNIYIFFSDAWRRRRRRRRGKMDENEMKSSEDHEQEIPKEAKRKIYAALFDEEMEDEPEDIHPKHAF